MNNVANNGNLEIFVKILDHIIVKLRAGRILPNMVKKINETGALKKEIVEI